MMNVFPFIKRTCALTLMVVALASLAACGDNSEAFNPNNASDDFRTKNRGDACEEDRQCVAGLVCTDGNVCDYRQGVVEQGQECAVTMECVDGLYCEAASSSCQEAGEVADEGACSTTADCNKGSVCQPRGFSAACVPAGEGNTGDACSTSADCLAGLGCGVSSTSGEQVCLQGPAGAIPLPYDGLDCTASDEDDGPLRFYFELSGREEFFRLPFPNDILLEGGRPNLEGFPTPGPGVVGFDIVATYIEAIERDQDRWGTNHAVMLRSSGSLDFDTITANDDGDTEVDERTLFLVDIDPESETYNERWPVFWEARGGGGSKRRYICQNWLAVRPFWGRPLRPDTTYAMIVTDGVKGPDGAAIEQDKDFAIMLSSVKPGNAEQGAAWEAYAPLRAWLGETPAYSTESVLTAAVFTTGDPLATTSKLRDVVRGEEITASDLTLCDAGVQSPCEDGLEGDAHVRGCFAASDAFDEIQGMISLPILQEGNAPYLDEGGAIGANPRVQFKDDVCMAMTVPKNVEMPEAGWPVLIYAHGTGGGVRNGVEQMSPVVSSFEGTDGPHGMLLISWDQVQHHTRRGDSELDPEPLVFNYGNPPAARGNFMQGAADLYAIVKYVESLEIPAAQSPTGAAIKADPTQVYFLGHSQGGTTGPLALPFEPGVRGAILSGAGASLTLGLLGKTSPVDSPTALKVAIQDPDLIENHPVLNLIQGYFDPVDPINYSPYLAKYQRQGITAGMNIFHIFGVGDTFSPPAGLKAMARSLYATYLGQIFDDIGGGVLLKASGEADGNRRVGEENFTIVGKQYDPKDAYDGHFVLFRDEDAQADAIEFLRTGIENDRPSLTE